MFQRLSTSVLFVLGAALWATPSLAQTPPPPDEGTTPVKTAPTAEHDFPEAPKARLERAQKAFQDAEYDLLRPLLEPTLSPTSQFAQTESELEARTLLGVGLYFEAQKVTDAEQRRELLDTTRRHFLEILRKEPDHSLNPLLYPASVVELFEAVREENAEELDKIRAQRDDANGDVAAQGLKSIYIQREVDHRLYAANFLPFGLGQFQNGEQVQGTLFAGAQTAALGLNVASYVMIESLRGDDGYYDRGAGGTTEQALQWRTAQYVGLGLFVGFYAWSVIDALRDYEPYDVRIRSLDEPPPELSAGEADDKGATFQIGLGGLGVTW
ncbi:hypothetical protein FIV42_28750 [Persicimonas caeni]|uniref:DUF5683 domain-containing protein n=1 Tax=Persicimonas caeni TaxID=2292766 RepID=A0A4Y6Q1W5_PERCE|nr:hypothetical protein [Persicimonas caeni]QDG54591.1 hypothetical protein FIV42_28750 [Persicimonas caeni]QED35812.1 hypothetical protein FRD00_28745 [Persicimonas caeni]